MVELKRESENDVYIFDAVMNRQVGRRGGVCKDNNRCRSALCSAMITE